MAGPRTALVADDDAGSRRLLVRLLEQHGWRVLEASDGQAALDCSARQPLDLVLLDLRMPGPVDGLRVASLLRQSPLHHRVPIIAVSASPFKDRSRHALAAGCTAFMSKPVNLKELLEQISQLTGSREVE